MCVCVPWSLTLRGGRQEIQNSVLGKMIEPQKEEVGGTGENFIRGSFMFS